MIEKVFDARSTLPSHEELPVHVAFIVSWFGKARETKTDPVR